MCCPLLLLLLLLDVCSQMGPDLELELVCWPSKWSDFGPICSSRADPGDRSRSKAGSLIHWTRSRANQASPMSNVDCPMSNWIRIWVQPSSIDSRIEASDIRNWTFELSCKFHRLAHDASIWRHFEPRDCLQLANIGLGTEDASASELGPN